MINEEIKMGTFLGTYLFFKFKKISIHAGFNMLFDSGPVPRKNPYKTSAYETCFIRFFYCSYSSLFTIL